MGFPNPKHKLGNSKGLFEILNIKQQGFALALIYTQAAHKVFIVSQNRIIVFSLYTKTPKLLQIVFGVQSSGIASMDYEYYRYLNSFQQVYRCYPLSHTQKYSHLESGDKIIMPPSALDRLAYMQIQYPMMFELHSTSTGRVSHCGVLEFEAEEGLILLPNWMMEMMKLQEGEIVIVKNVSLEKGTYMKLQPHSKDFIELSDPKAVLERTLRSFSCLTTGDSIMVMHNNIKYYFDVLETKPSTAISIVETDCEVDFAPPLDYKEPEKPANKVPLPSKVQEQAVEEGEGKFKPFTGTARRLDGTSLRESIAPSSSPRLKKQTQSNFNSHSRSGKLVFGSNNVLNSAKESTKLSKEDLLKEETLQKGEEKFQPFTGKGYKLTS